MNSFEISIRESGAKYSEKNTIEFVVGTIG